MATYRIERNIILDERVEGAQKRDIVLVDYQTSHALQQVYHIMSVGCRKGVSVFNFSQELLKVLKMMKVEEVK